MAKLTTPYGLDLARAKSLGLWTPNNQALAAGPAVMVAGPQLTQEGTVSWVAPGNFIATYMQSHRYANVAGVANNVAGMRYPTAPQHPFRRGTIYNVHGFYFSCRFTFSAWPSSNGRFFVGISNDTLNMASQNSTASVATDYFGIMHDQGDTANQIFVVSRAGGVGTRTKTQITGGGVEPVIAANQAYWLEMYAWSNQGSMSLTLWDLNTGLSCWNTVGGMTDSVWTGPQCVVSNGTVAANVHSLDIHNMYWFVGD